MKLPVSRVEQIERETPEIHGELSIFAAALLDSVTAPPVQALALPRAVEAGLVIEREGVWVFADEELRGEYLFRAVLDLTLAAWDSDEGLAEALRRAWVRGGGAGADMDFAPMVLLAAAQRGKDVIGRIAEMAANAIGSETHPPFWLVYHAFCEVLPHLEPDPEALVDALVAVQAAVAGDVTNGLIHSAVRELAGRSRQVAEALVETFLGRGDPRLAPFAADAILAHSRYDLAEAHGRAVALTNEQEPSLVRAGVFILGTLPYHDAPDSGFCEATFRRLAELRAQPLPDAEHALADAYGNLLPRQEAAEALIELAGRDESSVQHMVALVLMRKSEAATEPWFGTALHNLVQTGLPQPETLRFLDHALAKRAVADARDALSILAEWAGGGGLGSGRDEEKLTKTFSSTFRELRTNARAELEDAVTRWWASGSRHLHLCAWQVVSGHDFASEEDSRDPLALSASVLGELDENTVRLVLLRVMAYVIGGKPMARLLLSALRREPWSDSLAAIVAECLHEIALYNYPGGAGEYLESRIAAGDLAANELELVCTALAKSEEYFTRRRSIPRMTELTPPASRISVLQRARGKQMADAMEAAQKHSALLQLVRRVPIKYGRGFAVQRQGEPSAPMPLNSISHEIEVPQGELIDTIGEAKRRIQWRNIALDEAPGAGEGGS